jgi:hypothetical protein
MNTNAVGIYNVKNEDIVYRYKVRNGNAHYKALVVEKDKKRYLYLANHRPNKKINLDQLFCVGGIGKYETTDSMLSTLFHNLSNVHIETAMLANDFEAFLLAEKIGFTRSRSRVSESNYFYIEHIAATVRMSWGVRMSHHVQSEKDRQDFDFDIIPSEKTINDLKEFIKAKTK